MKKVVTISTKLFFLLIFIWLWSGDLIAQSINNYTQYVDASMFWKDTEEYVTQVESQKGDLYKVLGHHGPAIENLWVAYRFYFNRSMSIDVLSKFEPRLELKTSKWYGNDSLFLHNFGKDNYRVGETVGLGGIRLWDNNVIKFFDTDINRIGKVAKTDSTAEIQIITFDIPYKNQKIDIEVKMSVTKEERYATIEVFVLSDIEVEFATGIVINPKLKVIKKSNSLLTWGDYDSPAASEAFDVGTAIIYDNKDFNDMLETENQILIVSKPVKYLRYFITSSNEKELSNLNSIKNFSKHVENIKKLIY